MRSTLRVSAIALALCGGVGWAAAQTAPGPSGASSPDHTVPPPGYGASPEADLAKPAAVGPAQSPTAGAVNEAVPGATRQTMPSTISAENAKLDKMPIVSLQLPLTDEQKRQIADRLAKASVAPVSGVNTKVTETLPADVLGHEIPGELAAQIPETAKYKYVKLADRILLIDPTNWWVVSEIKQ